jgi:hypothetical protein
MEQLFNNHRLESSLDNSKKFNQKMILKILSIFRQIASVCFILIAFLSFSYAQKPDQVKEKGDITKNLRANYNRHMNDQKDIIPLETRNEFASDFLNAQDVTWKAGQGYNEAEFVLDGKSRMAFFNYEDDLIGTGYYVDYMDLPEKGRERIAKDYGDYIPEKAMFYEDDEYEDDLLNFFGNFLQKEAYFVLLRKEDENKEIVVQVTKNGDVSYFRKVPKK